MAYGLQIYNIDNSLAYDSNSIGGVFLRFAELEAGTVTGLQFFDLGPQSLGKTIILFPLYLGDHSFSVQQGNVTSSQNAQILWQNVSGPPDGTNPRNNTIIMVFAV